ncbi:MAG: 2-C-methyl-D-erythritol 2,4-cyclodiphosphate synthase [Ignavibacteriaceae bacterium]|nr:2-C-methyl-D-erythritol 2,4-cyclodiphosphate synthase [Ignavibacteriaceae bacterium]MCW8817539.1 2-C-methyl-D-erythritol 2,4-cyclodiphosphate synthase [Ignavibacteriaceae bacterium]
MIIDLRTGIGFDVHAFTEGRKLILGGIEIKHDKGLAGHSDADAVLHAITDALLGSLSLGDIGTHFPDDDPRYKNADSTVFLKRTNEFVRNRGFFVNNIDVVVMLQQPKISPYVQKMKDKISKILDIGSERISIKATTTEKLGFVGREEGISVMAVVTVVRK